MPLAWNAWGVPFLVAAIIHLAAALFIYFVGPSRLLNRALGITLFFGAVIEAGYGLGAMSTTEADAYAFAVISQLGKFVIAPMYLLFLGTALHTPLVRPLRAPAVRVGLVAAAVLMPIAVALWPASFIGDRVFRPAVTYDWAAAGVASVYDGFAVLVFLFALVASFAAFRDASPGPARERARWSMLAFGVRDTALAGFILLASFYLQPGDIAYDVAFNVVFAATVTISIGLLVYGVLKWHLFDLDLKIKWTLSRGTLAAVYLGVFLVVTQLAQNGFAAQFGWIWGGVAAGLLLFLLVPLQRVSERLANAAMPQVNETAEYLAHRRGEVYQGALEEILQDAEMTPKERAILDRLREKLGLSPATAAAIERDVREAAGRR